MEDYVITVTVVGQDPTTGPANRYVPWTSFHFLGILGSHFEGLHGLRVEGGTCHGA